MLKKYFDNLILNIRIQKLLYFILLYFGIIILLFAIYPFFMNIFIFNFKVFIYLLILIFIIFFIIYIYAIYNKNKLIEEKNNSNDFNKNYLLVVYELIHKNTLNKTERELIEDFEKIKNSIRIYFKNEFVKPIRFLYSSIILFFILFLIFPIFYSNALFITRKQVAIFPNNNDIAMYSCNLGKINGHYYIKHKNSIEKFNNNIESMHDKIYFKGPGVKSNYLPAYLIDNQIIDSVKVYVYPPKYQKLDTFSIISNSINITQYSKIKYEIFSKYVNNKIDTITILSNDTIIYSLYSETDTLFINVDIDDYPICKIIDNNIGDNTKDLIEIPFIAIDDYSIDYTGAIIKTDNDSFNIKIDNVKDSIYIISINTDSINTSKLEIIAFAKDNNPYKKQISYSMPLIITFKDKGEIESIVSDTLSTMNEFVNTDKQLYSRMEEIKNNIINNKEIKKDFNEQVNEIEKFIQDVKERTKQMSEYKLNNEIYKQLYEINKKAEQIDKELLKKIFKDIDMKKLDKMSNKELKDYINKNSEQIMKELKNLEKLLEKLKNINDIMKLKNEMSKLINKEENALNSENDSEYSKKQKEITNDLKSLSKEADENKMFDKSQKLSKMSELSKQAQSGDKKKAKELKKQMQKFSEELENEIQNKMQGNNIDNNKIIISLYSANLFLQENGNMQKVNNLYKNIYNILGDSIDMRSPIAILLLNGIRMTEMSDITKEEIIEYNYKIISFLLNSQKNGQSGGMSMEQMMNEMQSMSKTEQAISQMLMNMMQKGEQNGQMLDEIGKMQKEIADKMRQLSKEMGNSNALGDMETLADSLDYIAEQLKKGVVDQDILDLQKRVMNRMLNIQKSVYKQRLSEKRESKPGKYYSPAIDIILPNDYGYKKYKIRELLNEYLKNYNNSEYKTKVRKYYMEILK